MKVRTLAVPLGLVLLAGALPAGPARAQDTPGLKPPKKKDSPTFVPPTTGPAPEEEKPEEPETPPVSEEEALLEALRDWPSEKARRAARTLVSRYGKAGPLVRAALAGAGEGKAPDSRRAAALAWVVAEAGDREALPALLARLRDPRSFGRPGDLVDAVARLDPVRAKENLLPILGVPSQAVVDVVARALGPLLGPADVPDLLAVADGRMPATRRAALGLAAEADFPAARDRLEAALADPSGEVAAAAAATLGFRSGEDGLARLRHLALGPDARQGTFAALALVHAGERAGEPVLGEPVVTALTGSRGIRSLDPSARIVAAVALADLGYARPDPVVDPILEGEVVPVLLDAVAGTRFFSDLMTLKPLALARLRKLTGGTADLTSAPQWAAWWNAHRDSFTARRALTALPPDLRGSLRLRLAGTSLGPTGAGELAADPSLAPPAGGSGGRFVALAGEEVDRLVAAVEASGILRMPESHALPGDAPSLEVALEAGRRSRTVRVASGAAVPPPLEELLSAVEALRAANRWQAHWDRRTAPTFAAFVENERPFWSDPSRGEEDRGVRLVRLMVAALPSLDSEADRLETLRALLREPGLAAALGGREAEALASFAVLGAGLTPTGEAALRVLAAAGRTEGLSILYARLEDGSGTVREESILEDTFRLVPLEAVLPACGPRVLGPVRRAALRSLDSREATEEVLAAVREGTRGADATVRAAAYRTLGSLRAPDAVPALADAAEEDPDFAGRSGALEGLGLHGGPGVLAPLGKAVQSPDARTRAAAVRALAATREPEALSFVLVLMTGDPDPSVREAADAAVKATGGERAREALRGLALDARQSVETRVRAVEGLGVLGADPVRGELRALLLDAADPVADAAAFVLGWIRDEAAAPRLLDALRDGRSPARTLRCLEALSLESFRHLRDREEIARLYTGWYEVSRERGARGWLAEALTMRGLGGEALRGWEEGGDPRTVVPVLLKGLREEAWYLRRAANLELERAAGLSFGDIDSWTPGERAASIASAWDDWWKRETGAAR